MLKSWFTVFACLSFGSYGTTLAHGQYGIIINAFLIGVFWLMQQKRSVLAGLLLGLAFNKPTISALFVFAPIARKRIVTVLTFGTYLTVTTVIMWWLLQVNPIYMITIMFKKSEYFVSSGFSGINILMSMGLGARFTTLLLFIGGMVLMIFAAWELQNYSLLSIFAVASVIGRIWTYHYHYDNVMLLFLVVALLKITVARFPKLGTYLLSLVLLSLVLPPRFIAGDLAQLAQFVIWIIALFFILLHDRKVKTKKYA